MARHDILVIGSTNWDLMLPTPRFPAPGETLLGGPVLFNPGGKGANQAVAAARLGARVAFCGLVGDDLYGPQVRTSMESAGVDTRWLAISDQATGFAVILVDDSGQNMIVAAPGANQAVTPAQVEQALAECDAPVVLLQFEISLEATQAAIRAAKGRTIILNPAPAAWMPDEFFEGVTWVTPNETEAQALTGISPLDELTTVRAGHALLAKGCENAIITLGDRGSMRIDGAGSALIEPYRVTPVDTTACGDAFNGAFAAFLAEGRPVDEAQSLANKVGALCATRAGAQAAMPLRSEVLG